MFSGRIDRMGYFLGGVYTIAPIVIVILLYALSSLLFGGTNVLRSGMNIVLYVFGLVWTVMYIPVTVGLSIRRWHDLNETGWLTLLNYVPIIGYIIPLVMLFARGTDGSNNYGDRLSPRDFDRVLFGRRPKDTPAVTPPATPATPPSPIEPPQPGSYGIGPM
jgi:uncharacterized membrane protein YhaH (DUF805 family)